MTPKELIDKITLAAEQLESLRTEHDLPVSVSLSTYDDVVVLYTGNKKHYLEILINKKWMVYNRTVLGEFRTFDTYEELVEDIR